MEDGVSCFFQRSKLLVCFEVPSLHGRSFAGEFPLEVQLSELGLKIFIEKYLL
jgi:hypothetical protein